MNLDNYPFTPNYREIEGLRMHYVDEGRSKPTWNCLYLHVIPWLRDEYRCITPENLGRAMRSKDRAAKRGAFHPASLILCDILLGDAKLEAFLSLID